MFGSARRLSAGSASWEAIRDQEVRKAELDAEVELRRLEEERKLLEARQVEVDAELARLGESEANLRAHRTIARWWLALFILAAGVAVLSAWWSVNWYLTLTWEKALVAVTLIVLPLIGWMAFLVYARDRAESRDLWRLVCGLGLLVVLGRRDGPPRRGSDGRHRARGGAPAGGRDADGKRPRLAACSAGSRQPRLAGQGPPRAHGDGGHSPRRGRGGRGGAGLPRVSPGT